MANAGASLLLRAFAGQSPAGDCYCRLTLLSFFCASADASARGRGLMRFAIGLVLLSACALLPMTVQAAQLHASGVAAPKKDAPILLEADEVVYDSEGKTVSAVGHVEIS